MYLKFVGKGLKDGSVYSGLEMDGRTPIEILKGSVGKVSSMLGDRLLKDYPELFSTADEKEFLMQMEKISKAGQTGPESNPISAQQASNTASVKKQATTPEEMHNELELEPKKEVNNNG